MNDDDRGRIQRLATYNSERLRGLVHTEGYKELMRQEQRWFDNRLKKVEETYGNMLGGRE